MNSSGMSTSGFKVGFPIAAVFFGALVGPSMVSGIFSKVYYAPYGAWSFILALFYSLIVSVIVGFSAELVRRNKVYDYNSFCHVLYGKYSKICTPLMEIYMLMAQILTLGAVVAMSGSLLNEVFGWQPFYGSLLIAGICLILVLWGADLVRRIAAYMCVILLIGFVFITINSLSIRWDVFSKIMSTWYVPDDVNVGYGIWRAILFGFSAACNGMVLCAVMQRVQTKGHVVATGVWCFLLTTAVLMLEVLVILPYIPEVLLYEVPVLWIIQNFISDKIPWMPAVYNWVMLFALITSGVPANQAIIARVFKIVPKKGIFNNDIVLRACIGLVFLGVVLLIAQLGLTTIVSKGYSSLGAVGIPLIAIPTCIIMPIIWRRERIAAITLEKAT